MKIARKNFGLLSSGKKVHLYTLKAGDLSFSISTLGAAWTSLLAPSRRQGKEDLLLGFSTLTGYACKNGRFGATMGRFGNRISGTRFSIDGKAYSLFGNEKGNTIHGGRRGFDRRIWKAEAYRETDGVFVRFELISPDGDEGFPGTLRASVTYGLSNSNEIIADYKARVDALSPVNFTNHAYFNLAGEGKGEVLSHEAILYASSYLEVDDALIPTGKLIPVHNGPFDFRTRKPIGRDIAAVAGGYDHCFAVDGEPGTLRPCAEVYEESSGRSLRVFTTQPGVQFYTANSLNNVLGKTGMVYAKHGGFCLETQHFPDSPNRPEFPSAIFGPNRDYHERSVFSFSW